MVFNGTYIHTVDSKNRLAIPAEIRALLQEGRGGSQSASATDSEGDKPIRLYVMPMEGQALSLYTEEGFEKRSAELDNSELDPDELLMYERLLYSLTETVQLDKQGRVLLPEKLLKKANLGPDVVLIGAKDHLEIRDRQAWQTQVDELLARRPNLLMNPRRAMKRAGPATGTTSTDVPGAPGTEQQGQ